jgi:uncharacterized protein
VKQRVLADTGPIVAILSARDAHHDRCVAELADLRPPLITCWPVLTEALWLLRQDSQAIGELFRAFDAGLYTLALLGEEALPWLEAFMHRYRKIGAQLADASLVYLAEREGFNTVFSLDRRDFSVYRYGKNRSLKIIPERGA